jgi:hypothetical protein
MSIRHNLRVGKADTTMSKPAHVQGVSEGNAPGNYEKQPGHLADGTSTAERSTGIDPESSNPILPGMPNLSPP